MGECSKIKETNRVAEKKHQRSIKDSGYKFNQKLKPYIKEDRGNVENQVKVTADSTIQNYCKSSTIDVVTQYNYNMATEFFDTINKMNDMYNNFEKMYNKYEIQTKVVDVT